MKYYKRINNWIDNKNVIVGVIYKEDDKPNDSKYDLKTYASHFPESYKEVTERDYLQQELNNGNLVEGGYYAVTKYGNIFKYKTSNIAEYYIGTSCTKFYRNGGNFDSYDVVKAYRLATEEEIESLEACNKADEFVAKEEYMYKEKFVLPEYWCIKVTEENIEILSEWVKSHKDIGSIYLDAPVQDWVISDRYDGSYQNWSSTKPKEYKEITFKQFKKYVLRENIGDKVFVEIANDGRQFTTHPEARNYGMTNYHYWKGLPELKEGDIVEVVKEVLVNGNTPSYIVKDLEGVEYLINKEGCEIINKKEMEKEIIGYKLIKPEYKDLVLELIKSQTDTLPKNNILDVYANSYSIEFIKKAGVLDLWFEPVYEEEYKVGDWVVVLPEDNYYYNCEKEKAQEIYKIDKEDSLPFGLKFKNGKTDSYAKVRKATAEEIEEAKKLQYPDISINGYKAEFFDDYVQFGCAKMHKEVFIDLATINQYSNTNREVESVTIGAGTFSKEVIKQIVEYYKNREE